MKLSQRIYTLIIFSLLLISCREPYDPEINQEDLGILVVEGHIETGGRATVVKLSTTGSLNDVLNSYIPVSNAQVSIESQSGQTYPLPFTENGTYTQLHELSNDQQYRLNIDIPDQGLYQSEWLTPIISPAIENVGIKREDNDRSATEIYVSTHGNEDVRYFAWEYEETWIFNPELRSFLKFDPEQDSVVYRDLSTERIDRCWRTEYSNTINIASSARFQDEYIYEKVIQEVPFGSERFTQRYSILVHQRAISQEAFTFYETLNKNTNDMGDIFSPLPSNINTNVHFQDNGSYKAIGMVTAGASASKRVFFDRLDIGHWIVTNPFYAGCDLIYDTIPVPEASNWFSSGRTVPVQIVEGGFGGIIGYRGGSRRCTDCTLRGTNVQPDFWAN
ncbi:DUF4249 domain-containing protein [Echinicola vietnamensis]|uniref:DUF4249 domain-containing protein n=1 Tax=Echinicola vietnamensis (strain DSM 17526 / LMG 23754 / KMM 6221) TaxID=926556 RepID=L0G573_ECHVK|nr:DUF4249 domain-containing protein [Echinicola vietnamensis]AGA80156.1 hypothetical protein Echvi_3946 [Echinicola vietnamensis DSM 17526]